VPYHPSTAVIVPVYDGSETVEACADSLLRLDYPPDRLELIFVDDGSADATPHLLGRYGSALRVLREPRRGPAAARNAGLDAAQGEVVAFVDADSVVAPDWLRNIVGPLEGHSDRVVGGRILAARPCNWVERFGERIHDVRSSIEVFRPPYVPTGNWAMARTGQARFDETLRRCSDVDLSYRLFELGYSFCFQPDAVVYHRNERTLSGLFGEGFQHGYHAVTVRRRHRRLLSACGHGRPQFGAYAAIGAGLLDAVRGRDAAQSVCGSVFAAGKAVGRIAGSARLGYLSL
jgi:glycosyltransferase involved in cell wall biosynthesis